MRSNISNNLWSVLACPNRMHPLERTVDGAICGDCQTSYLNTDWGALDLRLQQDKAYHLEFTIPGDPQFKPYALESMFKELIVNESPEVDYSDVDPPRHLSKEMMSYFPRASHKGSLMLDMGCGGAQHREVCERAGFEYVGLDYQSRSAHVLGDAHSLPFEANSFEFILTVAVMEHIQYPFVATREAYRVLKPGGRIIGTVAFLEPFHGNSFYHHTHLGILNSLIYGGFAIDYIAPSRHWSVLPAQAGALFPGLPRPISRLMVLPTDSVHKLYWWVLSKISSRVKDSNRVRNMTGAFAFIARKETEKNERR